MRRLVKYAFIDRDGTLIYEPPDTYQIDSLDKLQILPGVVDGLRILKRLGYKLVMVSNQDGLGTPAFPTEDFEPPHQLLLDILAAEGIVFDQVLICPHLPKHQCACRKPKIGLLEGLLAQAHPHAESFVCGDRESDSLLANNLGVRFLRMRTNGNFRAALRALFIR